MASKRVKPLQQIDGGIKGVSEVLLQTKNPKELRFYTFPRGSKNLFSYNSRSFSFLIDFKKDDLQELVNQAKCAKSKEANILRKQKWNVILLKLLSLIDDYFGED